MSNYQEILDQSNDHMTFGFNNIPTQELAQSVEARMIAAGYKRKSGNVGNATYEKGNRVARLLLGAFYKYYKFDVAVHENDGAPRVNVRKATSGMSGGLIGVNQVKKEFKRLQEDFQSL